MSRDGCHLPDFRVVESDGDMPDGARLTEDLRRLTALNLALLVLIHSRSGKLIDLQIYGLGRFATNLLQSTFRLKVAEITLVSWNSSKAYNHMTCRLLFTAVKFLDVCLRLSSPQEILEINSEVSFASISFQIAAL
jgi:hypothetical protein